MTNREFFLKTWEQEHPKFVSVLKALPGDQLAYKPHDRSTTAQVLAWQLAEEARTLVDVAGGGTTKWETNAPPADAPSIVAAFEKHGQELKQRVATVDDAAWEGPARMLMDGGGEWATTMTEMFWGFLFDMIHHRGQLSTYIRPMGGKVPAIYGPSADSTT